MTSRVKTISYRARHTSSRRGLGLALAVFLLAAGAGRIEHHFGWDDSYYLAMTSSLVEDGDFDLRNDLLHVRSSPWEILRALETTFANGALANTFAVGTAVLWIPAYVLGLPARWLGATGSLRWNGAQLGLLHLLTLSAAVAVLWFLDRLLRRAGVRRTTALLAAVALFAGSPFLVFAVRDYTMSHLANLVAACWFVAALMTAETEARRRGEIRVPTMLLAGASYGFLFLTRWQSLTLGLLLAPLAARLLRKDVRRRAVAASTLAFSIGFAAIAALQLRGWKDEFGSWLTLPQGDQYMHWTRPDFLHLLLSGLNGLVWWTPLIAVGLVGLLLPWNTRLGSSWRWAALAVLLLDLYVNAAAHDWWGGGSFAARRLTADLPLVALGLANLCRRRRRWVPAMLVLASVYGLWVTALYSRGVQDLQLAVLGRPSEAPGTERESYLVRDPTVARAALLRSPLPFSHLDYFQRQDRDAAGTTATYLAMLAACLGTGVLLRRWRPEVGLRIVLATVFLGVLGLHARIALGSPPDAAERQRWQALVRDTPVRTAAEVPPPPQFVDAYGLVGAFRALSHGRGAEGARLLSDLGRRGYPLTAALAADDLPPENGTALWVLPRLALRATAERPGVHLPLGRAPADLPIQVRADLMLRDPKAAVGAPAITLGADDWWAGLVIDGGRARLEATGAESATAPIELVPDFWTQVELRWLPAERLVQLHLGAPGASAQAAVPVPAGSPTHLWLGYPGRHPDAGAKVLVGSSWQNLRVVARSRPET